MIANQAQELSKDLPILLVNRDITGKKYHFDRKFRTALSTKSDWISEEVTYNLKNGTIKWYTDGSVKWVRKMGQENGTGLEVCIRT